MNTYPNPIATGLVLDIEREKRKDGRVLPREENCGAA